MVPFVPFMRIIIATLGFVFVFVFVFEFGHVIIKKYNKLLQRHCVLLIGDQEENESVYGVK
jgi:nucleoside recognition membrane protein YjiH